MASLPSPAAAAAVIEDPPVAPVDASPAKSRRPRRAVASKAEKPKVSALQRKKADERYFLNAKGRYVSKKKSANGKINIQSRSIRLARKLLGLTGMVLLGKGDQGKQLLAATAVIRTMLKEGKSEEEAEALFCASHEVAKAVEADDVPH